MTPLALRRVTRCLCGRGIDVLPECQQVQRGAAGAGERGSPAPGCQAHPGRHLPVNVAADLRSSRNGGNDRTHATLHGGIVPGTGRDQIALGGGPTPAVSGTTALGMPMVTVGSLADPGAAILAAASPEPGSPAHSPGIEKSCGRRVTRVRLNDSAATLGSPSGIFGIVTDLTEAGCVVMQKDGRRNRHQIQGAPPCAGAHRPGTQISARCLLC
jgi:hypothetical protein